MARAGPPEARSDRKKALGTDSERLLLSIPHTKAQEAIMAALDSRMGAAAIVCAALAMGCGGGNDPGAPSASEGGGESPASPSGPRASAPIGGGMRSASTGGTTRWSGRVGGALGDLGRTATADAQGNVYIAGTFDDTAEVAGVPMKSAGNSDVFIAKFTPAGEPAWVRHFGGPGIDTVSGLAVSAQGNVYFTGVSSADLDLGGGPLNATGGAGIFLGVLDAFGNYLGQASFGGSAIGTSTMVGVDASGALVLAGTYQSPITFGATTLPVAQGTYDLFVARFAPDGTLAFAKSFGGAGVDLMEALAIDATGNVYVAGGYTGATNLGTGPLASAGGYDAFAAKIGADGTTLAAIRLGGAADDIARGVAIDAHGSAIVAGVFGATVDFGAGTVKALGDGDAFVTKRGPSLENVWTRAYGGSGEDQAASVACDSAGNVVVAGFFEQQMTVGTTPFTSAGARDAFLLKLDSSGRNVFSKHFGAMENDEALGVAVDGFGRTVMTGYFRTSVDFGAGMTTSAGETDVFLATFEP